MHTEGSTCATLIIAVCGGEHVEALCSSSQMDAWGGALAQVHRLALPPREG